MEEIRKIILDQEDLKQFGFSAKDIKTIDIDDENNKLVLVLETSKEEPDKKDPIKKETVKKEVKKKVVEQETRGTTKFCNKCQKKKSATSFNNSKNAPDGLQTSCRDCQKEYATNLCAGNKPPAEIVKVEKKPVPIIPKEGLTVTNLDDPSQTYSQRFIYKELELNDFRRKKTARDLGLTAGDIKKAIEFHKKNKEAKEDEEH